MKSRTGMNDVKSLKGNEWWKMLRRELTMKISKQGINDEKNLSKEWIMDKTE